MVLTGGASRRMGTDKALVEVDGVAMAARVASALAGGGCDPVVCQGGDTQSLAVIGMTVLADTHPGGGPVAAILDALSAVPDECVPDEYVVVCACDLAWMDAATVTKLITVAAGRPDADVVVACDANGPHLAGIWRPGSRRRLEALVAEGIQSYRGALERLTTVGVDVPPSVVANVNSPGDLH